MFARKEKKDDEESSFGAFQNLDKAAVLQEARLFNNHNLVAKKCILTLTKMLVLINRGDRLTKNEATDAFFAMTKLFQTKDTNLRRVLYIVIKEMSEIADDVIIVTSSLTKDINSSEMIIRAPAIRTLCKITDASNLSLIERLMKQAIVDKSNHIASSALVSSVHLISGRRGPVSPSTTDLVRKWANEIQETASNTGSDRPMVQFHALGLLYLLKRFDHGSILKMVQKFSRGGLKSPMGHCLMIRIAAHQLEEEGLESNPQLMELLESSLRNKSEIVNYEAARAIVGLSKASTKELAPAISILQLFCSNSRAAMRYAAVRTLNQIAIRHPAAVQACNLDLEQLITDSNRSVATLAITTLLKTGSESSIDRLLKQITSFMSDLSDEFKIVVVESCRTLAGKFPRKVNLMVSFLAGLLRNNGGYQFKKSIVLAIESMILTVPEVRNSGLLHLCEFIEDCDHVKLTQRILHLLGQEGPSNKNPRKFIRFIYNRIMLESASIRCAGTTALAKFGAACDELRPGIMVLLQRIMLDDDDEVRDRAVYYHTLLASHDKKLLKPYIIQGLELSVVGLERALIQYTTAGKFDNEFDLSQVPVAITEPVCPNIAPSDVNSESNNFEPQLHNVQLDNSANVDKSGASIQYRFAAELSSIPELSHLGPLFKSSKPVDLSEPETEYVVRMIKHVFPMHVVLEYNCLNTMEDQVLEHLSVVVQCEEGSSIRPVSSVPCAIAISCNQRGKCYVILKLDPDQMDQITTSFTNTLHFVVKYASVGIESGFEGESDEYPLEDASLDLSDHIQPCVRANFSSSWEEIGDENEIEETYSLDKCKLLEDTVSLLLNHLGLQACEGTDKIPEGKSAHQLLLNGVFRGGIQVLVRCKLAQIPSREGVTLQMTVRCSDPVVRCIISEAIG